MIRALHQPGTVTGVLPGDNMWQPVAQRLAKQVVLVPAEARRLPRRVRRVRRILLPLDGTARSAAEVVVLHVFDAVTVPKFWDQHAQASQA